MRSRCHWALLVVALVIAGDTIGQEKPEKDTKSASEPRRNSYPVEVRFADDSTVKAALLDKTIEVATRYGKLTVPVEEIRSIELGLRIPEETAKRIEAAVAGLGPVMTRTAETFADPQGRRTCGATFDHPALASRPVPACARGW